MADYHLPAYEAQGTDSIVMLRSAVLAHEAKVDTGPAMAAAYRMVAACALLARMDGPAANGWLVRSAQAFCAITERFPHLCPAVGKASVLRDAIAGGGIEAGRTVAKRLPTVQRGDEEYADEFHFQRYLIERFLKGDPAAAAAHLDALGRDEESMKDGRAELCAAFQTNDPVLFERGMEAFLEAHRARYDDLRQREAASNAVLCTEGPISIDGLAMVRLARIAGLATRDQYPLIPDFALASPPVLLPAEAWLNEPPVQ